MSGVHAHRCCRPPLHAIAAILANALGQSCPEITMLRAKELGAQRRRVFQKCGPHFFELNMVPNLHIYSSPCNSCTPQPREEGQRCILGHFLFGLIEEWKRGEDFPLPHSFLSLDLAPLELEFATLHLLSKAISTLPRSAQPNF